MADAKLFQYYERQNVLPTFGNFKSAAELESYAAQRRELFQDKLTFPPTLFREAEVLEFGPDSGENAMVFASWGARMTLAEPNKMAHDKISTYFSNFGLSDRMREIALADVEGFRSERRFDVVDAEGFIYTIQPSEKWLDVFSGLLKPGGYAVVSYYERYGGCFELALKAIHAAVKAMTGLSPLDASKLAFETKWNSIPHTRSFESWLMDVLENPFVRLHYFIDATALCRQADVSGFDSHAAWPSYRDALDVYWHKKILARSDKLNRVMEHLRRSRLSFLSGQKLYLAGDIDAVNSIALSLENLTRDIDALIDEPFGKSLTSTISHLTEIRESTKTTSILADGIAAVDSFADTLTSFLEIFRAIARRDIDGVTSLTRSNPFFIKAWGLPAHFLVLRKRSETSAEAHTI